MADPSSNRTVWLLGVCLLVLILLLIFFYKKLNKEAEGEYTIRNLVYKEGGVRDVVRGAAVGVGTRLGIQLWPQSEEDGEEMQSVGDVESPTEDDNSQRDDRDGEDEEDEDDDEDNTMDQSGEENEKRDDASSLEGSEAGEEERLMDEPKREENLEKVGEAQGKVEATGLLIDLKQFSGSAIWSEEGAEGQCGNVTAL
ncbi:protein SDA1 homolog [Cololabis saira]|uniref:protein SDA1 homolog n=1 Tax=Cololabis saira TaxID=129043 RepID=UPI002AD59D18|nr:protein SDA1 homolog [Cololabis saira]